MDRNGYEDVSSAATAMSQWGPNLFEVPLPEFTTLLKGQLLAPFFVFQVFLSPPLLQNHVVCVK